MAGTRAFVPMLGLLCFMLVFTFTHSSSSSESHLSKSMSPECHLRCNISHTHSLFATPQDGLLPTYHQNCTVQSLQNVCTLDVKRLVSPKQRGILYNQLWCDKNQKVQIKFINPTNARGKHLISYLHLIYCRSTFEDMGVLGNAIDLRVLFLINWDISANRTENVHRTDDSLILRDPISGLEDVGTLTIRQNQFLLDQVPSQFYTHLWPSMAELQITNITTHQYQVDGLVFSMPQLQSLDIDYNTESIFPKFPWTNIRHLHLAHNMSRTSYGQKIYQKTGYGKLDLDRTSLRRTFDLSHTKIENITLFQFNGSYDLISLEDCHIGSIGPDTFKLVKELQILVLSNNLLKELPKFSFLSLNDLRIFKIDHNLLENIDQEIFSGLKNLKVLHLQHNRLTSLGPKMFSTLPSLEYLDLSHNRIRESAHDAIGFNMAEINEVHLRHNRISHFSSWMLTTRSLKTLDISSNNISFESLVSDLSQLKGYEIETGNKESISDPNDRYKVSTEKEIKLSNNSFRKINFEDIKGDHQLLIFKTVLNFIFLNIEDNPVNCDCDAYLFHLFLKKERAKPVPKGFRKPKVLDSYFKEWSCHTPLEVRNVPIVDAHESMFTCPVKLEECPLNCLCLKRAFDQSIIVNCTGKQLSKMPIALPNRTDTVILAHNNISKIRQSQYYENLKTLDLSFNVIQSIDENKSEIFAKSLQVLKLDNNKLQYLPENFKKLHKVSLTFSNNPIRCDCHSKWIPRWMTYANISSNEKRNIHCASGKPEGRIIDADKEDFVCELALAEVVSISLGIFVFVCLILVLLLYRYRGEIKILLYFHLKIHPFDKKEDSDICDKLYDAFISYSGHDTNLVFDILQPQLESPSKPYRLCIHDRDFSPGGLITDNVLYSVKYSRRMIMLLTKNFLKSEWCHLEFQSAHRRVLKDRSHYLIVILFDNIDFDDLDEALKLYLKTNTYISYDSKWFWQRLFYAMPDKSLAELRQEHLPSDGFRGLMPKPENVALLQKSISDDSSSESKSTRAKRPESLCNGQLKQKPKLSKITRLNGGVLV